jgi:hypothetical protein
MRLSGDILLLILLFIHGVLYTVQVTFGLSFDYRSVFLIIALVLSFRTLYFKDRTHQIKTLIALSFLGDEVFLLALPILFIPKFIVYAYSKLRFSTLRTPQLIPFFFLLYSACCLIGTNIFDFSLFTIIFWILTFSAYLFIYIYYAEIHYVKCEATLVFGFLSKVVIFQIPILFVQALIHRDFRPGDSWVGSAGNSIVIGVFFFLLLLYNFVPLFIKLKRRINLLSVLSLKNIAMLFILIVLLYFNDSKMTILSFVVASVFYFLFLLLLRLLSNFRKSVFIKTVLVSGMIVFSLMAIGAAADHYVWMTYGETNGVKGALQPYLSTRFDRTGINAKAILYRRVFADLFHEDFSTWLFGVGPGKFGSKASNMLAYDVLYKLETQSKVPPFIKPYSSEYTKKYMADLWTKEQVEQNKFRSSTLSFPFAGLITIKAEYGALGLLFFLCLVYSFSYYSIKKAYSIEIAPIRNWAVVLSVFWFSVPFHMIFDNFHEKNYIMLPIYLSTAVLVGLSVNAEQK